MVSEKIKISLQSINNELQWEEITRIGVRTISAKEVSISFNSLCGKFKNYFFQDNEFINQAKDVGIPLVFKDGDSKINFNFGPMEKDQLKTLLEFQHDTLPSKFAYIDIDYYSESKAIYSNEMFDGFLDKALIFAKNNSEESVTFLGRE